MRRLFYLFATLDLPEIGIHVSTYCEYVWIVDTGRCGGVMLNNLSSKVDQYRN